MTSDFRGNRNLKVLNTVFVDVLNSGHNLKYFDFRFTEEVNLMKKGFLGKKLSTLFTFQLISFKSPKRKNKTSLLTDIHVKTVVIFDLQRFSKTFKSFF